ncbi:hypothetical protein LI031_24755, partial [Enterocloster citroniae]|nr:hypothetical protein [Enterocloster citroniae]
MGLLSRMSRAATALSKYYYPFTWRNKPSIESPINEVHLNHIEDGINEMDNRILILAQDKADASDMANVFVDFEMDDTTGVMTFTRFDGSKVEHDSAAEKIALNCYLEDDNFVLELADGTKQKVSLSKFIDTYTFSSSDTIKMTVNGKNISADIPDGKITLAKLEPTVLSTIRQYTLDAQTAKGISEQAAGTAQGWAIGGTGFEDNNAKHYASRSQRYAVGGVEDGDTEDNAKYYFQQAQAAAEQATEVVGFDGTAATVSAIDTHGVAVRSASGIGRVSIDDAGDDPILNLNIAGKSEQMATTGAQLLTDGNLYPGFLTNIDGTRTNDNNYRTVWLSLPAGTYTLSVPGGVMIVKTVIDGILNNSSTSIADGTGYTCTLTQDGFLGISFRKQDSSNYTTEPQVMLNTGSTAKPWEPYTGGQPSPSPDYPQPIISTGTVTTGAQLFDASRIPNKSTGGTTVTNKGDGSFTVAGDGSLQEAFGNTISLTHEETIALIKEERTFTVYSNVAVYPYFFFNFYDKNGTVKLLQLTGVTKVTESIPNSADMDTLYIKFGYYGVTGEAIVAGNQKVMVNAGSTPEPWELYTGGKPSPSPEYPQPLDVRVTGANLFDASLLKSATALGIKFINNGDGSFTVDGTATGYANTSCPISLPSGTYSVSGGKNQPKFFVRISKDGLTYTDHLDSFTINGDEAWVRVFIQVNPNMTVNETIWPMLNAGSTALPYQPYQSKTATIQLTAPLYGIGDVRDRIMCKDGEWGIERYWKHTVLDGSISYAEFDKLSLSKEIRPSLTMKEVEGLVSNAICVPWTWSRDEIGICHYGSGNKNQLSIRIPIEANTREYMADHPAEVIYCPENAPTWEPLSAATQSALNALTTFTGTTHITITAGGLEPDVAVEYFGQPGDKVTVQDMCDSFAATAFDDSGVVEEITSFQNFYDKFVSGMKIKDFFRNLKTGLKFVLHTGQLVNNGLCNEPGKYPLDA